MSVFREGCFVLLWVFLFSLASRCWCSRWHIWKSLQIIYYPVIPKLQHLIWVRLSVGVRSPDDSCQTELENFLTQIVRHHKVHQETEGKKHGGQIKGWIFIFIFLPEIFYICKNNLIIWHISSALICPFNRFSLGGHFMFQHLLVFIITIIIIIKKNILLFIGYLPLYKMHKIN